MPSLTYMEEEKSVRLQKFLSAAGITSRRAAENLIRAGEVTKNGAPAELGQKVSPSRDNIAVRGKPVKAPATALESITLVLNKPRGYLCSHNDPHHARTIHDLLPKDLSSRRFFCAGRLDLDSEGLVILTTDGELANRLMHPTSRITKRYRVTLHRPFPRSLIPRLLRGVLVDGEHLKAEKVCSAGPPNVDETTALEVHLHHGKKREIRRLFEALGFHVKRLKRFQIGELTLRGIPLGGVRRLGRKELNKLSSSKLDQDPAQRPDPRRSRALHP